MPDCGSGGHQFEPGRRDEQGGITLLQGNAFLIGKTQLAYGKSEKRDRSGKNKGLQGY